jgi:hypothetical protein
MAKGLHRHLAARAHAHRAAEFIKSVRMIGSAPQGTADDAAKAAYKISYIMKHPSFSLLSRLVLFRNESGDQRYEDGNHLQHLEPKQTYLHLLTL